MSRRSNFIPATIALLSAGAVPGALAGPLNPPAGPVASTPGPEPRIAVNATNTPGDSDATPSLYKITQPGSYYLTGNLSGVSGKIGIEVAASHVTLDLSGFRLTGAPALGSLAGINVNTGFVDVVIRNGSVDFWRGCIIVAATNAELHDLRCTNGDGSNIAVGAQSLLVNCISNGGSINCFSTGDSCALINCKATNYGVGTGFRLGPRNQATNCSVSANSTGFLTDIDCLLTACSAAGNGLAGGIVLGNGSSAINCVASANTGDGIVAAAGCIISACTCRANNGDNIEAASACQVLGNTCDGASGTGDAGIRITGADNRIDGNNVTNCYYGVRVEVAGNLVIRNSASGSIAQNYSFVGVQTSGPEVTATGVITSTNPWSNFSF